MTKTLTWNEKHLFISTGECCSIMLSTSERSEDFTTPGLSKLSPDGTLLVMRDDDHVVRVRKVVCTEWRVGDVLFTCQQLPAVPVVDFAWSPLVDLVAIQIAGATYIYQASGWPSRHGQQRGVYRLGGPQQEHPLPLAFAPKTKRIAQALPERGVGLWNADGTLFCHMSAGLILSIAWSPDGRYLALGGDDASVSIYLARSGRLLWQRIGQHTSGVSALTWLSDGNCLASGDLHGNVQHWNTHGSTETWYGLGPVEPPIPASIVALAWSPDGAQLASLDSQDQLYIFDIFPLHQ